MTRRVFPRSVARFLHAVLPPAVAAQVIEDLRDEFEAGRVGYGWLLRHALRAPFAAFRYHLHVPDAPPAGLDSSSRSSMGNPADRLARDLRYAFRSTIRTPLTAAIIVLTLALGVGANTAIFTVVDRVLLEGLPYADAEALVLLQQRRSNGDPTQVPPPVVRAWQEGGETLEAIAYARPQEHFNFVYDGSAERVSAKRVSTNMFDVLGVPPAFGRTFAAEEGVDGADPVVILSHGFWQRRFAGDSAILGTTVRLDATTYTVIGVMPGRFQFTFPRHRSQDVFVPRIWTAQWRDEFGWSSEHVIARRRAGVGLDQIDGDLERIQAGLAEQHGSNRVIMEVEAIDLHASMVGEVGATLWMIQAVVGFVLLVACANVVNLTLARFSGRRRELAVRNALGGARRDVLRPLLLESLVLGVAGGLLGLVVGAAALDGLLRLAPPDTPRLGEIGVDATVFGAALGAAIAASLAAGAVAAWRAIVHDPGAFLRAGTKRIAGSGRDARLRHGLVAVEACLVVLLLSGTGLMLRSLWNARQVDPGMDVERSIAAKIVLPQSMYPTVGDIGTFFDAVLEETRALPGVVTAGMTTGLPMGGTAITITAPLPEDVAVPDTTLRTFWNAVTPDYFEAAGIPLIAGRAFTDSDTPETDRVLIVNQSFVRAMWGDVDPIDRRVRHGPNSYRIVGVVGDTRYKGLEESEGLVEYMPHRQSTFAWNELDVVVKTAGVPVETMAPALRRVVHGVDAEQAIGEIRSLEEVVATSLDERRFHVALLASFAAVGLLLGVIGVYGVVSYGVNQRVTEVGIRLALGSPAGRVLRLVGRGALAPVAAGVVAGVVISIVAGRVMESFLFRVNTADPATLSAVVAGVLVAAAFASYLPARRATRVDPVVALRAE